MIIDSTTFWVRVPRLKVIGHPGFLQNSWRIWGSRSLTSCFFKIAPNIGLLVCYFFSNNLNWSFTVILIFFVSLFITQLCLCLLQIISSGPKYLCVLFTCWFNIDTFAILKNKHCKVPILRQVVISSLSWQYWNIFYWNIFHCLA